MPWCGYEKGGSNGSGKGKWRVYDLKMGLYWIKSEEMGRAWAWVWKGSIALGTALWVPNIV